MPIDDADSSVRAALDMPGPEQPLHKGQSFDSGSKLLTKNPVDPHASERRPQRCGATRQLGAPDLAVALVCTKRDGHRGEHNDERERAFWRGDDRYTHGTARDICDRCDRKPSYLYEVSGLVVRLCEACNAQRLARRCHPAESPGGTCETATE